jgi:DNA-binding beta-propeller fold protein YncE
MIAVLSLAGVLRGAAFAAPGPIVAMEQIARLEGPGGDPMVQPSDVVVAPSGAIWVLDGVRMRLARFSADSRFEAYVPLPGPPADDRRLPVGLGMDRAGRLLVGDRQRGSVMALRSDGALDSTITIPCDAGERPADPTDVLPSESGQTLLVADNDNHCIKEMDLSGGLIRRIGRRGGGPGELNYPATIALGAGGEIVITDVLNARVDVFDRAGQPLRAIGSQGVVAGKFYRPKGIATDRSGRVHVTDSFTGMVQTFQLDGRLVGVWGNAAGQPYRLKSPAGLFADGAGRFYVVEMLANSVSVWREAARR